MAKGKGSSFTLRYKTRVDVLRSSIQFAEAFDPRKTHPKKFPKFSDFQAIWDTGASNTVIDKKIVDDLNLTPTGKTIVQGVNGTNEVETYLVNIILPNDVMFYGIPVTIGKLKGFNALIGMDIIGKGDFAVTNVGETVMSFRIPSQEAIDFETHGEEASAEVANDYSRNDRVKIKNFKTDETEENKWKNVKEKVLSGDWEVVKLLDD